MNDHDGEDEDEDNTTRNNLFNKVIDLYKILDTTYNKHSYYYND